ncbi:hypothetical protein LZU96_08765 [Pantoea agglomerans]|uniref:hypothetical protein n=1 Tax=Pantoea TaxID=53335 RepID=UPI001F15D65D|nr:MULTISPECIES: hypothetical protein [Pantoea]UIL53997.1 hypothetical protein LZU96_08765 [Pantoea agglomerans]
MKIRLTVNGLEYASDEGLHTATAEVVVKRGGKEVVRDTFNGKAVGDYSRTYDAKDGKGDLDVTYTTESPHFQCKAEIVESE